MCNPRSQQRMLLQDCGIPLPRQPSPTCAATQLFPPNATDDPIKLPKASVVRRSPVILVVAAELGVKGLLLLVHRIVPVHLTPLGDRLQPPTESLADRPHVDCELPFPAACADVREFEEIERGWFLAPSLRIFLSIPPKFDQPWPGRAVARTGLRMMPTFPPLPLKSRTVSFPQYGFKAGLSDGPSHQSRKPRD